MNITAPATGRCVGPIAFQRDAGIECTAQPFFLLAGQFTAERGSVVSAQETIGLFVRVAGCRNRESRALADPSPPDGTHVTVDRYGGCLPGGGVESVVIEGGGHSWPGARQGVVLDYLLGPASRAIDANAELWRFFDSVRPAP